MEHELVATPEYIAHLKHKLDLAKVKLLKRNTGKLARRVSLANDVLRIQAQYEAAVATTLPKPPPEEPKPIEAPWDKGGVREEKVR